MYQGEHVYARKYRLQYCKQCDYEKESNTGPHCSACTKINQLCTGTPLTKAETDKAYKDLIREKNAYEVAMKKEKKETLQMLKDLKKYHLDLIRALEAKNRVKAAEESIQKLPNLDKMVENFIKARNQAAAHELLLKEALETCGLKVTKAALNSFENMEELIAFCVGNTITEKEHSKKLDTAWWKLQLDYSRTGQNKLTALRLLEGSEIPKLIKELEDLNGEQSIPGETGNDKSESEATV